eukprot:m.61379 g.61379  ORF g.61379 m.61379 type:complete len:56 (-) comp15759_c0_seq10:1442-1609(-)
MRAPSHATDCLQGYNDPLGFDRFCHIPNAIAAENAQKALGDVFTREMNPMCGAHR